jgi:RNA polymerase sigma-70 factor (ECF subfamily)
VGRVRVGDEGAFRSLFLSLYEPLWRFAFGCVRSGEAAEELVQAVFLHLWEHRERWDAPHGVRAYLYTAVRNRALNYARHERVVAEAASEVAGALSALGPRVPRPDEMLEAAEMRAALRHAVATLPERRRLALTLRWQHGMSYGEVATVLGTSAKAAAMQVARALDMLREALADQR